MGTWNMLVGVTNLHALAPSTLITTSSHTRALLWLFNEYSDDVARPRLHYNDFALAASEHVPENLRSLHLI